MFLYNVKAYLVQKEYTQFYYVLIDMQNVGNSKLTSTMACITRVYVTKREVWDIKGEAQDVSHFMLS